MNRACAWIVLVVAVSLSGRVVAETATAAFARGKTLLKQSDFSGAMEAFAAAARADRENQEYLQQYVIVRRVIALRGELQAEQDAERWSYIAQSLRAFYLNEGVVDEAIDVSRQIHARENTPDSAVLLAHTLLESKGHEEAAQVLSSLKSGQTPVSRALLGIALARANKASEATAIAASLQPSQEAGPGELYVIARLQSLVGKPVEACAALRRCLESVPPSLQNDVKQEIAACGDFKSIAGSESLAETLRTVSKVPESPCSGGASCAGCPMRGNCASNQQ